jgi:hypothetical protein
MANRWFIELPESSKGLSAAVGMKVKGMGTTAHNTLADEGIDDEGTTTGASGGRDDRAV